MPIICWHATNLMNSNRVKGNDISKLLDSTLAVSNLKFNYANLMRNL
jgi:hypothetical protein